MSIAMGRKVKDLITGLEYCIVGTIYHPYGCVHHILEPMGPPPKEEGKDDPLSSWLPKPRKSLRETLDEQRIADCDPNAPPIAQATSARPLTFKNGDLVKDTITGFQGRAYGYAQFLSGEIQVIVVPEELKDGRPQEGCQLEMGRLTVVTPQALPVAPESTAPRGSVLGLNERFLNQV